MLYVDIYLLLGHYMYIETSSPRQLGDIAWLVSEPFPRVTSSGRCLNFWYNMYGSTIDTLTVYIRIQGKYNTNILYVLYVTVN